MKPKNVSQAHQEMGLEVSIAIGDDAFEKGIMEIGPASPFACPECHGVLMQISEGKRTRYRCHTGHAFVQRPAVRGHGGGRRELLESHARA